MSCTEFKRTFLRIFQQILAFQRLLFLTYGSSNHAYREGRLKLREIHIFCNENFALKAWREDHNVQLFPFLVGKEENRDTHNLSG